MGVGHATSLWLINVGMLTILELMRLVFNKLQVDKSDEKDNFQINLLIHSLVTIQIDLTF